DRRGDIRMSNKTYGGPYECADDEKVVSQPQTFDQEVQRAMRDSIVKMIRTGDWCKVDYNARVPLDSTFLRKVQGSINMDNVLSLLTTRIEERMADAIFNAMA